MSAVMPPRQPKWLSLLEWAIANYGDGAGRPHLNTLRRWANEGRIQPQPRKHGKSWRVEPTAEYKAD